MKTKLIKNTGVELYIKKIHLPGKKQQQNIYSQCSGSALGATLPHILFSYFTFLHFIRPKKLRKLIPSSNAGSQKNYLRFHLPVPKKPNRVDCSPSECFTQCGTVLHKNKYILLFYVSLKEKFVFLSFLCL